MSLRLEEFSDRELLHALEDHADGDGLVSSAGLAEGMGITGSMRNVSSRLAWLKRYGVVYRDERTGQWGLTEIGGRIIHGGLRAGERRALDDLDESRLYAVMQALTSSMVGASDESAIMASRHWRYTLAERKRSRVRR